MYLPACSLPLLFKLFLFSPARHNERKMSPRTSFKLSFASRVATATNVLMLWLPTNEWGRVRELVTGDDFVSDDCLHYFAPHSPATSSPFSRLICNDNFPRFVVERLKNWDVWLLMRVADPTPNWRNFLHLICWASVSIGNSFSVRGAASRLMTAIYFLTRPDPCISISILIPRAHRWEANEFLILEKSFPHTLGPSWCWLDSCSESDFEAGDDDSERHIKRQRNGNYVYDNVVIHIKEKC